MNTTNMLLNDPLDTKNSSSLNLFKCWVFRIYDIYVLAVCNTYNNSPTSRTVDNNFEEATGARQLSPQYISSMKT